MFVDFNKIMKNDKVSGSKLPDAFVDYLSESLPEGTHYIQVDEGICTITPDKDKMFNVGGLIPKLNEHQKSILGNDFTIEELIKYVNNSQVAIELIPADGENVVVNGKKISANNLMIDLKKPDNISSLKQFVYPEKFSDPKKITLSTDDITTEIYIQRVADDSIYKIVYESIEGEYLNVKMTFDEKEKKSSFLVSIVADNIKTVQQVINSMKLYNAFLNGSICLDGIQLKKYIDYKKNYFEDSTIIYWEKLRKIEKFLNLSFVPNKEDVSYQTACEVEKLYQSLINKTPVIESYKVDSVNGTWDLDDDINSYLGKELFFKFEGTEQFELYEEKFELPCVSFVFNCTFGGVEQENADSKILLLDVSEEKKRYTSILLFKSKKEINEFDFEKDIIKFRDAKRPSEYI